MDARFMQTRIDRFRAGVRSLLFLILLFLPVTQAWALFGCTQNGYTCVSSGCKYINNTPVCTQGASGPYGALYVNSNCWQYRGVYTCYTGQQVNSCSSAQLQGCYQSTSTCTKTIPDGNCVQWSTQYVCPNASTTTCTGGPVPNPSACQTVNTTCNASSGSSCVNQTSTQVCPTSTTVPQCNTQGNCTLTAATCTHEVDGLCDLQQQTYSCGESKQVCAQEAMVNQCTSNMTEGLGTPVRQPANNDFQEAATYMGILNAISKDMTPGNLTIFPGKYQTCSDPILSGLLTNNCCNLNLTGKGGNIIDHCSTAEQQLTAARRAHRTHYLGRWCHHRIPLIGLCIDHWQGYCVFDSVLARIIQEQGREQIAQLAASGYAASQTGPFNFNYFSQNGGWGPRTTVNGNTVVAWQWPNYCEMVNGQVDIQAQEQAEQNGGIICPSMPAQWFAVCDSGASCAALPSDPRDGAGTSGWTVQNIDPQENSSYALDSYTVATGACNSTTGACNYQIAAWPAGSGGQADMSIDVGWDLYQPGSTTATENQITQLGNDEFQGVSLAGNPGAALPKTVPFNYSLNDGASWQQVQLPVNLPLGQAQLGPGIEIFGQCNPGSFQCQYTIKAPVSVTTMPWGTPQDGQCEGFTTAQLSVLNFNKMNLSQYVSSITPSSLNQSQMASNTAADAQSFYQSFQSGGSASSPTPASNTAAYICDNFNGVVCQDESASGQGPFQVELNASTTWPPSTGPQGSVTGVSVNWGDGSSSTASIENGMYVANHTYPSVNSNTTYTAVVTFQTTSGPQNVTIQVEDAAVTVTPNSAANTGGGITTAPNSTYVPAETPNGNVQNSSNPAPGVPAGFPTS